MEILNNQDTMKSGFFDVVRMFFPFSVRKLPIGRIHIVL